MINNKTTRENYLSVASIDLFIYFVAGAEGIYAKL